MGMVVRTNTMAVNAYRQLNMNQTRLAKSLEKLASGFRINRAADDAAGLAISEKMKAQIVGLEAASANALDGISLVQTAEGALTEVHAMLNRMVYLATKSANGTYQDEVDREAIQAEVNALLDEIDRIGLSANFNGVKLLDGSLSGGGAGSVAGVANKISKELEGVLKFGQSAPVPAVKAQYAIRGDLAATFFEALGAYDVQAIGAGEMASLLGVSMTDYDVIDHTGAAITSTNLSSGAWTDATEIIFRAKEAGVDAKRDVFFNMGAMEQKAYASGFYEKVVGADAYRELTIIVDEEMIGDTNLIGKTFSINGKTYQFVGQTDKDYNDQYIGTKATALLENGNYAVNISDPGVSYSAAKVAEQIMLAVNNVEYKTDYALAGSTITGFDAWGDVTTHTTWAPSTNPNAPIGVGPIAVIGKGTGIMYGQVVDTTKTNIISFNVADKMWKAGKTGTGGSGGLTLQIGDTNESFNKVTVSVDDLRVGGLGLKGLDVSTQDAAGKAIDVIKNAINQVSTNRANLGALQNRLEYTINNLDVMNENMQAANSRIRDTDMAKEMMEYTKMAILVQAAQAMLAQANMQPQSILQLLQ